MKHTLLLATLVAPLVALIGCEPVLEVGIVPPTVPSQPTQPPIDVDCEDCDPPLVIESSGFVTQPTLVAISHSRMYYNPNPVPTVDGIVIVQPAPHPTTDGEL